MRQVAIKLATAALAAVLAACQPLPHGGAGQIGMRVQFPGDGFQIKAIPDETASIRVTISGEGLTSPATSNLTRMQPSLLIKVPEGAKTVSAVAVDAAGKTLAQGSATVTVIANVKVTAQVVLAPEPDVTPTPTPSPTPSSPPEPTATPTSNSPTPTPTTTPTPIPTATPDGSSGGALATPTPPPQAVNADIDVQAGATTTIGHQDL
jgi:hypothetical protein